MNKKLAHVLAALVSLLLVATPAPANATSVQARYEQAVKAARNNVTAINTELQALEPYVTRTANQTVRLDTKRAKHAGASAFTLKLANELVAYQNLLLATARSQRKANLSQVKLSLASYPTVRALFTAATEEAVKRLRKERDNTTHRVLSLAGVNPCGDWAHPVPSYVPTRHTMPQSFPFWDHGFHRTAPYACNAIYRCSSDYTRGRGYQGPYGYCGAPAFRDQGNFYQDRPYAWIQFGEPNPEVHSYWWPYWNWASYVNWWHARY